MVRCKCEHLYEMQAHFCARSHFFFQDALIHKNEKDPQQNPHNQIVAQFLNENYSDFFEHYSRLLRTDNYVTIRQSLKLLSELLLNRENFSVLQRYVADEANLKVLLRVLSLSNVDFRK